MKINLLFNKSSPIEGSMTNLDPFADGTDERQLCHPQFLDQYVDAASCEEILARDVIDFLDIGNLNQVIDHWVSKLRHGGTITIGGTDLMEVCRAFAYSRVPREHAVGLLNENGKRASLTLVDMQALLQSKGLSVVQRRLDGFTFSVTAKRI